MEREQVGGRPDVSSGPQRAFHTPTSQGEHLGLRAAGESTGVEKQTKPCYVKGRPWLLFLISKSQVLPLVSTFSVCTVLGSMLHIQEKVSI